MSRTPEQASAARIEMAARADRPSGPAGTFVEQASHHLLSLAAADREAEAAEGRRAARAVARQAPDALAALGLTGPPAPASISAAVGRDLADMVLARVPHGDQEVRDVLELLTPVELEAARAAIRVRVEDR